jgi:hypothetical protein
MCKEYEIDRAVNGQHGGSSCPLGEHTYTSPSSHILCSCRILEASYHMLVYNHHALLRVVRANRSTIMHELARGRIDHTRSFLARALCHNGSNNPPPPPGCRALQGIGRQDVPRAPPMQRPRIPVGHVVHRRPC